MSSSVALDDGEDDDALLGPPPDPSLRHWRHPSEIASANAAALRDLPSVRGPRWRSWSFLGGCALGLVGVLVIGTAVIRPLTTTSNNNDGLLLASTPTGEASPSRQTPATTNLIEGNEGNDPADTKDTGATTSIALVPPPSLPETVTAGESGVLAILDADDRSLVASGLVIDGTVISSANELAGRSQVLLATESGLINGTVEGVDPFSDLVVITVLDPELLPTPIRVIASPTPADHAMGDAIWLLSASDQPEPSGTNVTTPLALAGELTGAGDNVATSSGEMTFDALQTTIRTPDHGPGGALLDSSGNTIGMVISCDQHLAAALPIGSLRIAAQSIRDTGWAHIGWLGIEGEGSESGIELVQVESNGPAATAGLLPGDRLLSVDGQRLQHVAEVVRSIRRVGVGNQVEFEVDRDGEVFIATITVGARIG